LAPCSRRSRFPTTAVEEVIGDIRDPIDEAFDVE
jgi:hypothetical protein